MWNRNSPFNQQNGYYQGYQTYQQPTQPMYSQNMNYMNNQIQYDSNAIQCVKYGTREEALGSNISANNSVLFIDRQNNTAYLKSSDAIGQSYIKGFKFEEIDMNSNNVRNTQEYLSKDDLKDFVTKDELSATINTILEKLNIQKEG